VALRRQLGHAALRNGEALKARASGLARAAAGGAQLDARALRERAGAALRRDFETLLKDTARFRAAVLAAQRCAQNGENARVLKPCGCALEPIENIH
jgi:hypothetical protein